MTDRLPRKLKKKLKNCSLLKGVSERIKVEMLSIMKFRYLKKP